MFSLDGHRSQTQEASRLESVPLILIIVVYDLCTNKSITKCNARRLVAKQRISDKITKIPTDHVQFILNTSSRIT